jgi:hypothetical protein
MPWGSTESILGYITTHASSIAILVAVETLGHLAIARKWLAVVQLVVPD